MLILTFKILKVAKQINSLFLMRSKPEFAYKTMSRFLVQYSGQLTNKLMYLIANKKPVSKAKFKDHNDQPYFISNINCQLETNST